MIYISFRLIFSFRWIYMVEFDPDHNFRKNVSLVSIFFDACSITWWDLEEKHIWARLNDFVFDFRLFFLDLLGWIWSKIWFWSLPLEKNFDDTFFEGLDKHVTVFFLCLIEFDSNQDFHVSCFWNLFSATQLLINFYLYLAQALISR